MTVTSSFAFGISSYLVCMVSPCSSVKYASSGGNWGCQKCSAHQRVNSEVVCTAYLPPDVLDR